jgi:hypothetical protein
MITAADLLQGFCGQGLLCCHRQGLNTNVKSLKLNLMVFFSSWPLTAVYMKLGHVLNA